MILLLVLMATVMTMQVILRYALHAPLPWAEEFCRYCQIWSTFVSIGYCTQRGIMLQVDILVKSLSKCPQWILETIVKLIIMFVYLFFFHTSFKIIRLAYMSNQVSAGMGVPIYIIYSITTVGFLLGIVRQIQDIVEHFVYRKQRFQSGEV